MELRSRDLKVRVCTDNESATYLFRCPVCRMIEVRPAEAHVVDVLLAAGVPCTEWRLPGELNERRVGDPIDHDDVLDFHDLLSTPDWFVALDATTDR